MSTIQTIALLLLFFSTSVIGVVTGSNSLITVPAMFQFGVDEKVAVATNMFGLTFMSIGAAIPFIRQGQVEVVRLWPLVGLTIVGSTIGALIVGVIANESLKLTVTIAMLAVIGFSLFRPQIATSDTSRLSASNSPLTLILAFVLAIYGGLYSGGYVTILTAVLVSFSGMSMVEAVGSTKIINVFSSLVATIVFVASGLVDLKLGILLAIVMSIGGYIGGVYASRMNEVWLRRIFLAVVLVLAAKSLFDIFVTLF